MDGICYIIGAGEIFPSFFSMSPKSEDLLIAADAGYLYLERMKREPDITVGDFDSLGFLPAGNTVRHPVKKNDTDMLLAIRIGLERGYKRFALYGATGGRLDHTLANIQALSFIAENGARGVIIGNQENITLIKNSSISFSADSKGILSVFCMGKEACGVSLENLLYPLSDATVSSSFPIGVSNEFTGKEARVTVNDGSLVVFFEGSDTAAVELLKKDFIF